MGLPKDARPPGKTALAVGLSSLLVGCPAPPTALARAQQTAQEFNEDARFGRNELVMDRVALGTRDEFALHHRGWGSSVRVADMELVGMQPHGDRELWVVVRVAWYRPEQQDLHTTTLQQTWREVDGWKLTAEKRLDGDVGLLSEPVVVEAPTDPRPPARFPTVHLRGTQGE